MKALTITLALFALHGTGIAQEKSDPAHRFSIGLLGHYHTEYHRFGLSGHVKWLLPTQHPTANRFVITAKASHTAPSNGPFFSIFDDGKYDNISALYLMGGYRVNLFDKARIPLPSAPVGNNSVYLELNVGAGRYDLHGGYGVALNPSVGYSFNQGFELTMAYQSLVMKKNSTNQHFLEIGIGYQL